MAKTSKILFLAGMPGSGKTHWARKLAEQYSLQLLDTDQLIEAKEQQSIPAIFETKGETYFRQKEQTILKEICTHPTEDTMVSLGGGTPCFYDNLQLMKQAGKVIYLKASIETLYNNLKNEISNRPLLKEAENDLKDKLQTMLATRQSYYEQADYIFEVEALTLTKFAKIFS